MSEWELEPAIEAFYDRGGEVDRLTKRPRGRLEFLRTQDIIRRVLSELSLPGPELSVLDVGGATGIHSGWLAADGHRVRLVDPVESQVSIAAELPGVEAVVGDARDLPCEDDSFDAVLLMGPLYHLTEREHRLQALREACRVVKPGGLVATATINRLSTWTEVLHFPTYWAKGLLKMEDEFEITRTGRIPYIEDGGFTIAYLHHPSEIAAEFRDAGFGLPQQYAVQGIAEWLPDLGALLDDDSLCAHLLDGLREIEQEPSLLGSGAHLLTVARV